MLHSNKIFLRWTCLIALSLMAIGLRFVWLSPLSINYWVLYGAYWFHLGLMLLTGWVFWRVQLIPKTSIWLKGQGLMIIVALFAAWMLLLVHERFSFKVNFDEHVLLGISRKMHFDQISGFQADGKIFYGTLTGFAQVPDKRPVLFSFFLSWVHSLFGYRPANVFALNAAVALVALLGVYRIGFVLAQRWGGLLAVSLFAGVPLVAQNATGGGFDLFNVTLIILLGVSVQEYLRKPMLERLALVGVMACCAANGRYESILYSIVPFLCLLSVSLRKRRLETLPWELVVLPVFVFPALLSNGVFNANEQFFQMARTEFWNIKHYGPNLAQAVGYMFDPDRGTTNSLLLSLAGVMALVIIPLLLRREWMKERSLTAEAGALLIIGSIVLVNVAIALGLGWGGWMDVLVSRFTLPFWFLLAWATVYVLCRAPGWRSERILPAATAVAALFFTIFSVADASSSRATNKMKPEYMLARTINELQKIDPWRRSLIVAQSVLPYINYGYPAVSIASKSELASVVEHQLYDRVIVVLRYCRDAQTGKWIGDAGFSQFEGTKLRTLSEFTMDPFNRIVMAQIESYPEGKAPDWISSSDSESVEKYEKRVYMMLP